jgi:hypothetical protein
LTLGNGPQRELQKGELEVNNDRRDEIAKLDAQLREALKQIEQFKYSETYNHSAKSPNGTEHYPLTWSMLDNAETNLKEVIVWLGRARAAERFGSTVYDMKRPIAV